MKTTIAAIIILVLVGLGLYAYGRSLPENRVVIESTTNGKVKGIDDVSLVKSADITWKFDDQGTDDATGIPATKVSVKIQQNVYPIGIYQGTCNLQDPASLDKAELSGVLCWYAGFGDELGVYKEDGRLIIKHQEVEEGTAESAATKGELHIILTL